jgi:hypothetical protein
MAHKIAWHDSGMEPKAKSNSDFPNGRDIDTGFRPACKVELPYPAKRIGYFIIYCEECGVRALCTTAGRLDDPRSMFIPCKGR